MSSVDLNSADNVSQCSCAKPGGSAQRSARWATAGGILSALGICAACCLLPFALVSAGIAGAWVSALDSLAPYKWIFIALTAALLGYGFYVVYRKQKPGCSAGSSCRTCQSSRSVRIGLWIGAILAVSGILFEYIEPMLA